MSGLIENAIAVIDLLHETEGPWSSATGLAECAANELLKVYPNLSRSTVLDAVEQAMRMPVRR